MVSGHCLIVNCGFRRARKSKNQLEFEKTEGKPVRFFQVPAAIMNQGDAQRDLTAERRRRWISAIYRSDLTYSILKNGSVCSRHFTSGSPAQSGKDSMLIGCQDYSWDMKNSLHRKV